MGGGAGSRVGVAPLGALAALIALAGIGVVIAQPSTAASPAVLHVDEPAVEVQREGREGFSAAASGDSITEGAVIRTDRTGVAAVTYEDGSLTRIGPATTYELVTLRTEEGRREIVGKLDTGQTFHRVTKVTGSASRFEVETSDAVASVRGTAFAVQCLVLDTCEFAVTEGTVRVTSTDGRQVDVTAGQRVTVDGDGRLGELELLSLSDPWIARNAAEAGGSPGEDEAVADSESTASPERASGAGFMSWGRYRAPTSPADSQSAAAEPADQDSTAGDDEGARNADGGPPTTSAARPTETTRPSETTSSTTASPTTTTSEAAATTTTAPAESTTTSTTSGSGTSTTTPSGESTTTTAAGGEQNTTTSTTSGGVDGTTTTTPPGDGDGTTTTTTFPPTTPTSEPGSTTTAPCPEGEEHVEGRGCMPECPHDRPRDPNGNCRPECQPGDESDECQSASASSSSSEPKDPLPLLWVISFLFGGTVLVRRAPDRWDN